MIEIITALMIKHFLADYVFNPAITPTNKHIYGSIGSLAHVGTHMLWCFALLVWILPVEIVAMVTLFDGFIHYHEDWIKTKYLYKRKGLSDRFRRIITGFDQLVHMLTYIVIAWAVT
jgi:hypothetical protein